MPALIDALSMTTGPILEVGSGVYSTPLIHWWCYATHRPVVTYEQDPSYYQYAKQFVSDYHSVHLVRTYDEMDVTHPWSVVIVDHTDDRRVVDMARVRHAEYVILHDSTAYKVRGYKYRQVYPYPGAETTVFSNVYAPRNLGARERSVGATPPPLRVVTDREMQQTHPGAHRRYTICRAVREVYAALTDSNLKNKLRYACSLAEVICNKVDRHDPGWLRRLYPRRAAFDKIMSESSDV